MTMRASCPNDGIRHQHPSATRFSAFRSGTRIAYEPSELDACFPSDEHSEPARRATSCDST
ncbi:MAG TPA: hypothetical protein DCQ98_19825 [Planctomycetaceae bacterium]|nr:hypothetical protein [Planctomycetaceae bacterium]